MYNILRNTLFPDVQDVMSHMIGISLINPNLTNGTDMSFKATQLDCF